MKNKEEFNSSTRNIITINFRLVFSLLFVVFTTNCIAQNNKYLNLKASILNYQSKELKELTKIADIIDSDTESYWAYQYTDSIIGTIDKTGLNYYNDLTKIYSAYTHVFYGMSYTKTTMSISRGDNYSLEELNNTIIMPSSAKVVDFSQLNKDELSSIYSVINFYKVGRMPRYEKMNTQFQKISLENQNNFKNYSSEMAYRITSLNNKKLFYMIFVGLIIDVFKINNQNINDEAFNQYAQGLINIGGSMDEIPSTNEAVVKLTEQEYFEYVLKGSKNQNAMLNLLINEIRILKQRNK